MKIICNNIIPFPGFIAINLFGFLFVRKEYEWKITDIVLNHESIHTAQQKEMLYIFFYLWYIIEYFIKLIKYFDSHKAYRNISFEKEAYNNEKDINYLKNRKHYSWFKFI